MTEFVASIVISIVSLIIGYVISQYQDKNTQKSLVKLLRPFEKITLKDEYYMTHILSELIKKKKFIPDIIVALTPGGSMIGEWLSRRFLGNKEKPIPMFSLWMEVDRDKEGRHLTVPKVCGNLSQSTYKKILLVNDISRTGRTLEEAKEYLMKQFPAAEIKVGVLISSEDARQHNLEFQVYSSPRKVVFEWKDTE